MTSHCCSVDLQRSQKKIIRPFVLRRYKNQKTLFFHKNYIHQQRKALTIKKFYFERDLPSNRPKFPTIRFN